MSEIQAPQERYGSIPNRVKIEAHRRLVSEAILETTGISEYSDSRSGQRIMTIPRFSEHARIHHQLLTRHIQVFPVLKTDRHEDNVLLAVPNDARTIEQSARFIARDVLGYDEIFTQIGEVLGRLAANKLGQPKRMLGRTILGGVAFSLSDSEAFGGNVHLIPPYSFDQGASKADIMKSIHTELLETEEIKRPVADALITVASMGWNSVRS
jgi:hypothetical protein